MLTFFYFVAQALHNTATTRDPHKPFSWRLVTNKFIEESSFDNVGRLLEQLKMQRKEKMGLVIVLDSQVFPRVSRYLKCIAHISFDKGDEKHKR